MTCYVYHCLDATGSLLYVGTGRPRWTWTQIADQLADDTNGEIVVSREALRQWYGDAA